MASHGIPRVSEADPESDVTKQKQQQKIKDYRALVAQVQEATRTSRSFSALPLTSKLLTQNPEYYTIWNERRRILNQHFDTLESQSEEPSSSNNDHQGLPQETTSQAEIETLLNNDLAFLFPLLVKFPKCYWIWNHRLWLLQQASQRLSPTVARKFWTTELNLATKMLAKDSRNFHGWGYRRMVVAKLESERLRLEGMESGQANMIRSEFDYTTRMVTTNLSNFSAWHNRSKLIPRLLDDEEADHVVRERLLKDELQLILEALYTDPYDQSLWFYHTFLTANFSPATQARAFSFVETMTAFEKTIYLEREIAKLKALLREAQDCKWIYQRLLELCLDWKMTGDGFLLETNETLLDWLEELKKLDPLRAGRWEDLGRRLSAL